MDIDVCYFALKAKYPCWVYETDPVLLTFGHLRFWNSAPLKVIDYSWSLIKMKTTRN